jgi:gamma-glutamyltranspeptidase / glutathione hydrolase
VAVDAHGNTAALCHSINTAIWGTTGIIVDGIPIPDPGSFQQPALARLAPGQHLPMPVEPAIALRENSPVLACSSIGAGLHPVTVLGLHRVLGLGQPVCVAASAPLIHARDIILGDSVTSIIARREGPVAAHTLDDRFDPTILDATRARGHALTPRPVDDPTLPRGFWAAITRTPHSGQLHGARTPYGQGPVRAL